MLKPDKSISSQDYFSPKSKCCTYYPDIPNYLAGKILSDKTTSASKGRKKLSEEIRKGSNSSPAGISGGKLYDLLYNQSKHNGFGKSNRLICPFFDEKIKACSIWQGRSSVCSTYFCRYNQGKTGERFWLSIQFYLKEVEKHLSNYAIYELDAPFNINYDSLKDENLMLSEIDGTKPDNYSAIWGKWLDKEEEFYIRAYEIVSALDQKRFEQIIGINNELYINEIQQNLILINKPVLPERIVYNKTSNLLPLPDNKYLLSNPYGTFEISNELMNLLREFDGKKTTAKIISDYRKKGIQVDKELLISLYHFDFLKKL